METVIFIVKIMKNWRIKKVNTEQCTEITDNSEKLRQGDILFFPNNSEDKKFGIIVTGDCDIAQNKCRRIISYCTITTVKYYISTELLFDTCISTEMAKLKNNVIKLVCRELKAEESSTFFYTLIRQTVEDLRSLLKDKKLIEKVILLKNICNKSIFSIEDYKSLFFANNNKDLDSERIEKIEQKILSKINSLPGDKYYINELPNQNDNLGYIVHLRFINTISQDDIENQKSLFRIGHLESPYLYKLTQKLGAVFSDIGEPENFEKNRCEINKMLIKEI